MEIIIGILTAAVVVVLLALSIPVDLLLSIDTAAADKIRVRLGWLFGLLQVDLHGGRPRDKPESRERKKFPRLKRAVLSKGLFAAAARFLRRLLRAVRIHDFRLCVRFGFDNPADTGMLLAAAAPALEVLQDRLVLVPHFDQEIAQADGNVDVRIYPVRIVIASVMFLLSWPTLKAAKALLS